MKKNLLMVLISLGFVAGALAQATNDAGLWTTFNLDKKLTKKFSVFLTEEYRLRENFTQTNLFYTDLGAEVRPAKFLKVSLAYRLIEKNSYDHPYSYRHRLLLDITLKEKFGNFGVSYRQRIQREVKNVYSSKNGIMPEWYSRNKVALKYDLDKPITPYIATEFCYQFHNPRLVESDKTWNRNRYSIGMDYKRNNRNTFGIYYLFQQEFNVSAPQNLYIIGLEYSLSL